MQQLIKDHGHTTKDADIHRFGRMFPEPKQVDFDETAHRALADSMTDRSSDHPREDLAGVSAMYTYFGQFVDHDMTCDAEGGEIAPSRFSENLPITLATPTLDLDSLYGENNRFLNGEGKFNFGAFGGVGPAEKFSGKAPAIFQDVLRDSSGRVQIADSRNEDNIVISAIHVLFMQFHNLLVTKATEALIGRDFDHRDIATVKHQVVRYYQGIVIYDYLPKILDSGVLNNAIKGEFSALNVSDSDAVFMPLEFSGAAFRFGHSMVRTCYDLNYFRSNEAARRLLEFTNLNKLPHPGLLQRHNWRIDWKIFNQKNSRKIDTHISPELMDLPHTGGGDLAFRNLKRGAYYRLPTGQDVAQHLGVTGLSRKELQYGREEVVQAHGFDLHTPLWFYVLAEAEQRGGGRLGEIGSMIVAETICWLTNRSKVSILKDPLKVGEIEEVNCVSPNLQAVIDVVKA